MTNNLTARRLQLHAQGYVVIPTHGKRAMLAGWNTPDFVRRELRDNSRRTAVERITRWEVLHPTLQSTGIRIEGGLCAIDSDCDCQALADAAWRAVQLAAPGLADSAPIRYAASEFKFALFCRIVGDPPLARIASGKFGIPAELAAYRADPDSGKPAMHGIEIFTGKLTSKGNCSHHMSVDGPHSYNADGSVAAEYAFGAGPTLFDTALDGLPVLTVTEAFAIVEHFERLAVEAGYEKYVRPELPAGPVAFDIDENSRFSTDRGSVGITYDELCSEYDAYGSLRCSANFMPGRGKASDTARCVVGDDNRFGVVGVFVFGDEVLHLPKALEPVDPEKIREAIEAVAVEIGAAGEDKPDKVSLFERGKWLLAHYGYHAPGHTVVELHKPSMECELAVKAFQMLYRPWREETKGPNGGKVVNYATALWETASGRVNLEGVRMRPDQPFPIYREDGLIFKNTYQRPRHPAEGGDVAPFVEFMSRFIPDAGEREWLLDWLAHKQARPGIPGTAVVLVADNDDDVREGKFGTGRGMFFRILHQLFGVAYTRSQSFGVMSGRSGQSDFNSWMHGCVLVTVDEARSASPTGHRRGERSAAYDVLKDIVDPAPKRHSFKVKYGKPFDGMSYCSFIVATNHGNAVAIPASDRRFTVLRNGDPMTPPQRAALVAWMANPANIGALAAWLETRDLSSFDMFVPLETEGKAEMAEHAMSDVEHFLRELVDDPKRGMAFTKNQLERVVMSNFRESGAYWHGEFSAAWPTYCVGLKTTAGNARRVREGGVQRKLFCFRPNRKRADKLSEAEMRSEAVKWGGIDLPAGLAGLVGLTEKSE